MLIGLITSRASQQRDREIDVVARACRRSGHDPRVLAWDNGDRWHDFDVLLVRSPWNYETRLNDFLARMRSVRAVAAENGRPALVNDERLLRWSCHKRYLLELARDGIPVVPTRLASTLSECLAGTDAYHEVVIKPAVGAGASGCARVHARDLEGLAAAHETATAIWPEVIVQPYMESIAERGEISAVVIGGDVVRTVRKTATSGEWRVQREFGGSVCEAELTPPLRSLVERCLRHVVGRCDAVPVYMRLDLMMTRDGVPLVSEVELIEPVLYSDVFPDIADRLVAALPSAPTR